MDQKRPTLWIVLSLLVLTSLASCIPSKATSTEPPKAYPPALTPDAVPTVAAYPGSTGYPAVPSQTLLPTSTILPTNSPTQVIAKSNSPRIAFIGTDGNLWLIQSDGNQKMQITQGANEYKPGSEQEGLVFSDPQFTSDGTLLAYTRRIDRTSETGIASQYSVLVYELTSGNTRLILEDQQPAGYSWQPGSHKLAYGLPVDNGYFSQRGQVDATKAKGIWEYDDQAKKTSELIPPERGFSLARPEWSPLGDKLTFQEVYLIEGQGKFAYYDYRSHKYIAWDRPIGAFSWSPDEKHIVYDYNSYTPTPGNQIWMDDGLGLNEVAITSKDENAYVIFPQFSPKGDLVAYIGQKMDPATNSYQIYMQQPTTNSQPKLVGTFEQPGYLSWSPDGKYLSLAYGLYPQQTIAIIPVVGGEIKSLSTGIQPVWQP